MNTEYRGSQTRVTYYETEGHMKGYLTIKETATKWNISPRWVSQYVEEGRIPGVERLGKTWAIPEDAEKPEKQKTGPKPGTKYARAMKA